MYSDCDFFSDCNHIVKLLLFKFLKNLKKNDKLIELITYFILLTQNLIELYNFFQFKCFFLIYLKMLIIIKYNIFTLRDLNCMLKNILIYHLKQKINLQIQLII